MKRIFQYTLVLLGMLLAFSACNNNENTLSSISTNYANLLANGERANLILSYSGESLIGKQVRLDTQEARTATLTFHNLLPHEAETTVENITLTPDIEGGYSFEGDETSILGTTFHYDGKVQKGNLTLHLNAINIPSNLLVSQGVWDIPRSGSGYLHLIPQPENKNAQLVATVGNLMGNTLLSNLFATVLRNVKFSADGNIQGNYASIPTGFKIKDLLSGSSTNRPETDYQSSPLNLAIGYIEGDSILYLTPQIDMIIRLIQAKQTKAEDNEMLEALTALYKQLNIWSTTGIRLAIKSEGEAGSYLIYLDQSEIATLRPLLELAKQLLPNDLLQQVIYQNLTLEQLLTILADGLENMEKIEIGIRIIAQT